MLEISSKTNLLEQKSYKYSLQDVAEPNLQRDVYSYGTIPKVAFNHRRVPMSMPEEIWITDTSLRDGQQSVEPYSVDQIVNIYKLLSKLGGPYGIIRQTEFFIYSKKDREAIEKCMALDLKFPEITSWIRATKEDFQLVHDLGIKETGILVSCSDYHIFKKMKMTRKQAMDYYLATVKEAFNAGVIPRCHLEDITRADFYGFVVPFVNELQRLSREAGVPVKIRACDTMGYGVPFTEAALPRSVAGIIYGLQHYSDVPSEHLEWHGHNDFYKGVANASTAWLYGADYFKNEIGYNIPPMTPFVGSAFNVTRAGVHADGLMKDEEIYTIFDTKKILNKPATVQISKTSGLAGVAYWINQTYGLEDGEKLDKKSPLVIAMKEWVDQQYEDGRQTVMTERELKEKIRQLAPDFAERG